MHIKPALYSGILLLFAAWSFFYLDRTVTLWAHGLPEPFLVPFHYLTDLGDSLYPLVISLGAFLYFRNRDRRLAYAALYLILIVAISGLSVDLIKIIAGRARPELWLDLHQYGFSGWSLASTSWSFPSGHSATAFSFFVGLGLLYPRAKWLFLGIAVLVGASRVLLECHYLSDVIIGGWFGTVCAYWVYHRFYLRPHTARFFSLRTLKLIAPGGQS